MTRGKASGTDGAVLERSKPTKELPKEGGVLERSKPTKELPKEKALCVELREILKLPQYQPGELAEVLPRKQREGKSVWDIEQSAWRARREELSPLVAKVAKSRVSPEDKDEIVKGLEEAEKLSYKPDLEPAYQKLEELESLMEEALADADASPEGKRRGQKKERRKAALEQQRAEKELLVEATLSALPPTIDLKKPRAILARHKVCVPEEEKVLDEFETLDDLLTNKALKGDPDLMKEKLTAIGAAMKAAFARQKEMALALAAIPKPQKTADAGMGFQDDEIRAYQEVTRLSAGMVDHVPQSWIAQWTPNFSDRIANLTATDEEKQANLEEAKKGFSPEKIEEHRKALGDGIGSNSVRKLDRVEFFFDQMTTAATPEQLNALAKMQDEVIAVGTKIRDSGGDLSDVTAALAHIPEAWWPPQFIDYLQAWRKTERERVRLAVAQSFEELDKTEAALDGVNGVLSFVGVLCTVGGAVTKVGGVASGGGEAKQPWTEATQVQKAVGTFVSGIQNKLQDGRDGVKAVMDKEFFDHPERMLEYFGSADKMWDTADELLRITKETANTFTGFTKGVAPLAGVPSTAALLSSVLPGIALAAASIDLYLAVRSLYKHARTLDKTKTLLKGAEVDWATKADEDGGAFVRALGNEISARNMQLKKDSVEVTVKGVGVGAATAYTVGGHIGAGVGLGLVVTGKVISYGGKVVFTNIEWSQANVAKKLIKEARAGSPSARLELMSECGLYAKMYIAILAREGHPKATEFVGDRGIEESDLEGGPLALKIVVDEMLKDADQPDETKIEDNLLLANFAGVGGKGVIDFTRKVGDTGKSLGEWIEGKLDKNRETPYDDKWKHKAEYVALTEAAWSAAKSEAKKAGLLDAPSGVGKDLKALEAAYAKLQKAGVDAPSGGSTLKSMKEAYDKLLKGDPSKSEELKQCTLGVLDSLDTLYATLMSYEPLTNPQGKAEKIELHRGMYEYVSEMKTKVATEQGKFDASLVASGHKITDWSTDKTKPDPDEWKTNFADCATKSYLSQDDRGVGKALKAYQAAATSKHIKDQEKQKRRAALIAAYDSGNVVLGALDELYGSSRECQGLRVYIDNLKRAVTADMRLWDEASVTDEQGHDWTLPVDAKTWSPTAWNAVWKQAVDDGMASADLKDGGLGEYLTKAKSAQEALDNEDVAKKKMKARKELEHALAKVFRAARDCSSAHKSAPKSFTQYALSYAGWAQDQIKDVRSAQAKVDFDIDDQVFSKDSVGVIEERAKEAGAVGSSDGTMKKLKEALGDVAKQVAAFEKAVDKNDAKAQRDAALKRNQALTDVITATVDALSVEGYADNDQMRKYLSGVKDQATNQQDVDEYKLVLNGTAAAFADFDLGNYTLDKSGWEKVKKAAVEAGLLPDSKTGFGAALESADKSYQEWKDADDQLKKATPAKTALNSAMEIAEQMGGATANKNLKKYFDDVAGDLRIKRSEAETDLKKEFQATFKAWSKSDWKKVKAEAILRGCLTKKDETGLDDALPTVKKEIAAWDKLSDLDKMAKGESVQKHVVKLREIAITYRDGASNKGFKDYFDQMRVACDIQIKELQKDRVGGKDLKLDPFEWSQEKWQAARKQADEKGVLNQDDKKFGGALKDADKAIDKFRVAQDKNDKKAIAKNRKKAEEKIKSARQMAADLSAGNTHAALKQYFDQALSQADDRLKLVAEDKVEFTPRKFDWTNIADWETTRKEAVKLKLLDEKAASKFGDELQDAAAKHQAFEAAVQEANEAAKETVENVKKEKQAKALAKKISVQEPARAALTKARQTAEALKKQTQHKKLQDYFNECLVIADEWLKVVQT